MNNQSFTKLEHELIHDYRNHLNLAESQNDVCTVFSRTILELLLAIFKDSVQMKVEDIKFSPEKLPAFALSENLLCNKIFCATWSSSDLPHIVARLAENAEHRYKYLQAHHEKTGSKIGRH